MNSRRYFPHEIGKLKYKPSRKIHISRGDARFDRKISIHRAGRSPELLKKLEKITCKRNQKGCLTVLYGEGLPIRLRYGLSGISPVHS